MSDILKTWLDLTLKELQKHAERDDCYNCKQLLKASFAKIYLDAQRAKEMLT